MEVTQEKRTAIEKDIVDIVIAALDSGSLAEKDLPVIGQHVLDRIDKIETQDELILFLEVMAEKWSVFTPLVTREKGVVEHGKEQNSVHTAEDLIKTGNIDEALKVVKGATSA